MKQHSSKMLTFLLFVCALFFSGPLPAAPTAPPVDIEKAALKGLEGFVDLEKYQSFQLGEGFRVHTVHPKNLLEDSGLALQKMIVPLDMWRFIVLENSQPKGLLTMAKVEGQWQAVSFGAADLAAEIQTVKNAWPKEDGFGFRFVRIYQARSDFMEIRKAGESLGYAPLAAAKLSLSLQNFQLEPAVLLHDSEILEPLKRLVKQTVLTGYKLDKGNR
jgi:hypothetical protein